MQVRAAQVAGQFYPADPERLRNMIERFLAEAAVEPQPDLVCALVAPHAGYIYSGAVAAHAYKRIEGARPGRVVIMGVSHRQRFQGISLCGEKVWQTPLGENPVDTAFAEQIRKAFVCADGGAHEFEHTLETQLPFVRHVLGPVPVVPMLFGSWAAATHAAFGERLAAMLERNDLVVASTDMSHFFPEERAVQLDRHSIDRVLSGAIPTLVEELRDEQCSMCGGAAVVTALAYAQARGAARRRLLNYATSGAVSGDYSRVVGYSAISFEYEEDPTCK